jgi:hypothetical protein
MGICWDARVRIIPVQNPRLCIDDADQASLRHAFLSTEAVVENNCPTDNIFLDHKVIPETNGDRDPGLVVVECCEKDGFLR